MVLDAEVRLKQKKYYGWFFSLVKEWPWLPGPFELLGIFEENDPRCEEGGVLEGSPLLYCDGSRWNGTAPQCMRESPFIILFHWWHILVKSLTIAVTAAQIWLHKIHFAILSTLLVLFNEDNLLICSSSHASQGFLAILLCHITWV